QPQVRAGGAVRAELDDDSTRLPRSGHPGREQGCRAAPRLEARHNPRGPADREGAGVLGEARWPRPAVEGRAGTCHGPEPDLGLVLETVEIAGAAAADAPRRIVQARRRTAPLDLAVAGARALDLEMHDL